MGIGVTAIKQQTSGVQGRKGSYSEEPILGEEGKEKGRERLAEKRLLVFQLPGMSSFQLLTSTTPVLSVLSCANESPGDIVKTQILM